MVTTTLAQQLMDEGKTLVERLDGRNLSPTAALWFYFPDAGLWKLMLLVPGFRQLAPQEAYRLLYAEFVSTSKEFHELTFEHLALARPDSPVLQVLATMIQTGKEIQPIRFSNNIINGVVIEDAYIYRLNLPQSQDRAK